MHLPFDPELLRNGTIHLPHPIILEHPYNDGVLINASPHLKKPTSAYLFVTPCNHPLIAPSDGHITKSNIDYNHNEQNSHYRNFLEIDADGIGIRIEHIEPSKTEHQSVRKDEPIGANFGHCWRPHIHLYTSIYHSLTGDIPHDTKFTNISNWTNRRYNLMEEVLEKYAPRESFRSRHLSFWHENNFADKVITTYRKQIIKKGLPLFLETT